MINLFEQLKIRPSSVWKAAGYAAALSAMYYDALRQLVFHGWGMEDYSHCSLIPLVVAYFIWEKRDRLAHVPSVPSLTGLIPFMAGIGLYWVGELGGEFFTLYLSLWLVLVGLVWMHLGLVKIREIAFPLIVLLAAFPFPNFISVRISLVLQIISTRLGVWMLHVAGMSAYREGNVIDLGFTQLQVVEACSGLRYVIPLMILSLILAYMFRAALWKKAVLFLSAIPLAIFMNSFRIAATGILHSRFGPEVAEGFFHGFSGWLLFVVATALLILEMGILGKLGPRRVSGPAVSDTPVAPGSTRLLDKVWYGALVGILLVTSGLSRGVEFREKIPAKQSFAEFPMSVGEWAGTRQSMEQKFIDALHFSDYITATYRNPQGRDVEFYVAYYESQRKGETTHSPETCLPGSGWEFRSAGLADVPAQNGKTIRVNRSIMEKSGSRLLTYFWFPQRDRILTSLPQVKLYSFWDALTRQRTDGALVRLITPVYPDEGVEDAEKRLKGFASEMVPVLSGFLPE